MMLSRNMGCWASLHNLTDCNNRRYISDSHRWESTLHWMSRMIPEWPHTLDTEPMVLHCGLSSSWHPVNPSRHISQDFAEPMNYMRANQPVISPSPRRWEATRHNSLPQHRSQQPCTWWTNSTPLWEGSTWTTRRMWCTDCMQELNQSFQ